MHDAAFGDVARAAARTLLAELGPRPGGLVVDLGCGSGILAAALVPAGLEVLGVDRSEHLLALARRRAPGARFVNASLYEVTLPACRAVTATGEALSYGADPAAGRAAARALFGRARAALGPGGVLLLDVVTPGCEPPSERPRRSWLEGAGWVCCLGVSEDPAAGVLTRAITLFRRHGGGWRRSDERHLQWVYPPDAVRSDLEAAGFALRPLRGYAGLRFRRGRTGFAARAV